MVFERCCARCGGGRALTLLAAVAVNIALGEPCRAETGRLMREMGLAGVIRGKPVRTTVSSKATPCPLDQVNRELQAPAPNRLWVSDFTYVATWAGFVYVAFVIDVFARYIVGWRVSRTAHAAFVLDAPEQGSHERKPVQGEGIIHHSDRGSQQLSITYTERLSEAGIGPSVDSTLEWCPASSFACAVGDSYDCDNLLRSDGLTRATIERVSLR
jgi:putative transposase